MYKPLLVDAWTFYCLFIVLHWGAEAQQWRYVTSNIRPQPLTICVCLWLSSFAGSEELHWRHHPSGG